MKIVQSALRQSHPFSGRGSMVKSVGRAAFAGLLVLLGLTTGLPAAPTAPAVAPPRLLDPASYGRPVKVACVGDSITQGLTIKNPLFDSYPSQLKRMLGEDWEVRNFGVMSKTLLQQGDQPYQNTRAFTESLKFEPDLVIIKLGTNDTKEINWSHQTQFINDYKSLIAQYQALPSNPKILLCYPAPVVQAAMGIRTEPLEEQRRMIQQIATEQSLGLIDLYTPLLGYPEWLPDKVHPNVEGAHLIARTVYQKLMGQEFTGEMAPMLVVRWHEKRALHVRVGDRVGTLVIPDKAAPGKPWVFRVGSLQHDPQILLPLLEEGWHAASVELPNTYGTEATLAVMEAFQQLITEKHGLNAKSVLECYGSGSSAAFAYAAFHPERVASIYADGGVFDFRFLKPGQGQGIGHANQWEQFKKAYQFPDDASALAAARSPIDNLQPLATAKIPIYAACGEKDNVVVTAEQAEVAAARYQKMGGTFVVQLFPNINQIIHGVSDPSLPVKFIFEHAPKP